MIRRPPILYVEGGDDISVVSNLLARHGVDTKSGEDRLKIRRMGNDDGVLGAMTEAIKSRVDEPVGFVVDIDEKAACRWGGVCQRIRDAGVQPPAECPPDGYIATVEGYRHPFGVWMMADCVSDGSKMEHIIETLVPTNDPLWQFAKECVQRAAVIVSEANAGVDEGRFSCYRERDKIKAEVHTWLAWQRLPGTPLGAAINDRILGHDSPMAMVFLSWLGRLYGFPELSAS